MTRAEYQRQWRAANPDKVRAHNVRRRAAKRAWHEANRERKTALQREWAAANPDRIQEYRKRADPVRRRARASLNNAIAAGRVQRQPCVVCGEKAEGHHDDYTKPLDVTWLCKEHHATLHYACG